MVSQTFVWWSLYILHVYKFVKSPSRHLSLAVGNVATFLMFFTYTAGPMMILFTDTFMDNLHLKLHLSVSDIRR